MSLTTVVIAPRERFSSIIPSLRSLYRTIARGVPVIVVEGASPAWVRLRLRAMRLLYGFELISLPQAVTPNEARNIGAARAKTPYIAFCDNDLEYQPDWLGAMERSAEEEGADVVAPTIFIGPMPEPTIHHAGGYLYWCIDEGETVLRERHRLMNVPASQVEDIDAAAPPENEVCEFHCLLMRKAFLERMGGLDERLITREQMDLALRARGLGAKVTYASGARVTYMAREEFGYDDLRYHLFRWSDARAVQSIEAFEESWGIKLDAVRIRERWIAKHRARAIATLKYERLIARIGKRRMKKYVIPHIERRVAALEEGRSDMAPNVPDRVDAAAALASLPVEPSELPKAAAE